MESAFFLDFIFRVYSKTIERSQLSEVETKVKNLFAEVISSEGRNLYRPVPPDKVENLRERGFFLTSKDDDVCVVTQEMTFRLPAKTHNHALSLIGTLNKNFPKTFCVINITQVFHTDVGPS